MQQKKRGSRNSSSNWGQRKTLPVLCSASDSTWLLSQRTNIHMLQSRCQDFCFRFRQIKVADQIIQFVLTHQVRFPRSIGSNFPIFFSVPFQKVLVANLNVALPALLGTLLNVDVRLRVVSNRNNNQSHGLWALSTVSVFRMRNTFLRLLRYGIKLIGKYRKQYLAST